LNLLGPHLKSESGLDSFRIHAGNGVLELSLINGLLVKLFALNGDFEQVKCFILLCTRRYLEKALSVLDEAQTILKN